MTKQSDKQLHLQGKKDLASLVGFLDVLAIQITVLCDNFPDGVPTDSERLEEVQKELLAIARSVRMASTMADTAHDDYKTLLEKAYAPIRPVTLTEEQKEQIREVMGND